MRALALVGAMALFGCDDPNVHAAIECFGLARGTGTKAVMTYYRASKYQDGSCDATVALGGGGEPSHGDKHTRRSDPRAATCPVPSFHGPMLRSDTTVSGGVIRVESPFCAPGACQMLVATNCTGLNTDRF